MADADRRSSSPLLINPARRAVKQENVLAGCLFTGTDKIRSGYGNGDCILIDQKNLVFAVADATERFPASSRSLLSNLIKRLESSDPPRSKEDWLDIINDVYEKQSYNHKTTLSCVAFGDQQLYVIHGGDSTVMMADLDQGEVDYTSKPDMYFAGRAPRLKGITEIPLGRGNRAVVIASDGMNDLARRSDKSLEEFCLDPICKHPLHEAPERVARLVDGLDENSDYDDVAVIAVSIANLKKFCGNSVLLGGTSASKEKEFQRLLRFDKLENQWTPVA